MANVVNCPNCSRALRVPDDLLGQSVQCPSCQTTFTAALPESPRPSGRAAPREEPEEEPAPRRRPRRDEEDDDDRPSRRSRRLKPHRGDTIQLLGILSFFIAGPILGPIAWIMGNTDLREMDAGRMDPSGRSATSTGRMCGMISTILYIGGLGAVALAYLSCCCCGMAGSLGGHH
jgi:predicted Zn finger-like uncharacterized protein